MLVWDQSIETPMTWHSYPKVDAQYCEWNNLVLTARPNGAWSVHDTTFEIKPRNSIMSGILGDPKNWNLEVAKRKAEEAAHEMLSASC